MRVRYYYELQTNIALRVSVRAFETQREKRKKINKYDQRLLYDSSHMVFYYYRRMVVHSRILPYLSIYYVIFARV